MTHNFQAILDRYDNVKKMAADRRDKLNKALNVHQFFRDIDDEESWIKEKKLLVSSDDYGRDLPGVQNLRRKHRRLDTELASHEPLVSQVRQKAQELILAAGPAIAGDEIEKRMQSLEQNWTQMRDLTGERQKKLHESEEFQVWHS